MVWYFVWLFPVLFWIFSSCVSSWYTLLPFILLFLCDETSCVSPVSCYLCAPSLVVTSLSAFHIVSPGFLACFVSWTLFLYLDLVFLPLELFFILGFYFVFNKLRMKPGLLSPGVSGTNHHRKFWTENVKWWRGESFLLANGNKKLEIRVWKSKRPCVTTVMSQCSADTQSVPCDITVTVQTS